MKITFEYNKRENTTLVYQESKTTKVRIATIRNDGSIVLTNIYRNKAFKEGFKEETIKESILYQYNDFKFKQSPLKSLDKNQMNCLKNTLDALNVLGICIQDQLEKIKFLNEVDVFDQVTSDLQELSTSILKFTENNAKIVGIDSTIEMGEKADEIYKILYD